MRLKRSIYISINAGVLTLFLSLVGCGGGGGGSDPQPPAEPSPITGSLDNNQTVRGIDGVAISAMSNTLPAPIDITISQSPLPVTPLPTTATGLGQAYVIQASDTTPVSNFSPFVISLPVPAGADTEHLALAVQISPDSVLDSGSTEWRWSLLSGRFDAASMTFETQLSVLLAEGRTYVLVEHPDFMSSIASAQIQAKISTNTLTQNYLPGTVGLVMQSYDFIPVCVGLSGSDCPDSMKQAVANKLADTRTRFRDLGFDEPYLQVYAPARNPVNGYLIGLGYVVYIHRKNTGGACADGDDGSYTAENAFLDLCMANPGSGALTEEEENTIVHEYFHATQFAYEQTLNNKLHADATVPAWFIEGTATAAEKSLSYSATALMNRLETRAYHKIDKTLESILDDEEYQAQDYWVYAGLKHEHVINYLIPILINGSTIYDIHDHLFDELGDGNAADLYWNWVKNQAFEHVIEYNDLNFSALSDCELNTDVIEQQVSNIYGQVSYGYELIPFDRTVLQRADLVPMILDFHIPALSSFLIRLEVIDGFPHTRQAGHLIDDIGLFVSSYGSDPEIRYKVYIKNSSTDCLIEPDGDIYIDYANFISDGGDYFAYVLVSNTSYVDKKTFRFNGYRVAGNP